MEMLLHSGIEHPNTLWIAVAAVVTFVLGVGVGACSDTIREFLGTEPAEG